MLADVRSTNILVNLIARIRDRSMRSQVLERAASYAPATDREERMAWQLAQLNRIWQDIATRIPRYKQLVLSGQCPQVFSSLNEYSQGVAPVTKAMVQSELPELTDPIRPHDMQLTTGGSTGEPVTIPAWREERDQSTPDRWLGRHWYGIHPGDRLFMLWGHSHLLGTGLQGWMRGRMRKLKDAALGYHRFSAYQLDDMRLRTAADEMLRFRPGYVVAYSSALDYFARVNQDRADDFARLKLRGAIGTTENFPSDDSADVITRTLHCPVGMEYGSVETGVMGHTAPDPACENGGMGELRLFWRSYLFEAGEVGPSGGRVLRITSLTPRKLPLIRYETGDEVLPAEGEDPLSLVNLKRVLGKSLAFVTMDDGTAIHSVAFEHAVRACPGVQRFQLVSSDSGVDLKIVAPYADHDTITRQIRETMSRIHPSLMRAKIEFTDTLWQTKAGKTPLVIRQ
ncbi:MAG TPA: hypothetical protein VLE43_00130 [Candidatus Saccharimonadia bacterium]|nr:hypothetical protein [Candidatus Saccharimonadia bacterium]